MPNALFYYRIGLALCTAGKNPGGAGPVATINIGVNNLPVTAKTDLANRYQILHPLKCFWCCLSVCHYLSNKCNSLVPVRRRNSDSVCQYRTLYSEVTKTMVSALFVYTYFCSIFCIGVLGVFRQRYAHCWHIFLPVTGKERFATIGNWGYTLFRPVQRYTGMGGGCWLSTIGYLEQWSINHNAVKLFSRSLNKLWNFKIAKVR